MRNKKQIMQKKYMIVQKMYYRVIKILFSEDNKIKV